MIGSCIAFNPCFECDEKANCNICELTYYRNGYIKSPTADAVEVVRCKDCKHYCLSDYRKPNEPKWCEMFYDGNFYPNPNDYCFYGERREENER
jgi:hypothetical protein